MRYFFSTGEASGENVALLLAAAIRTEDPDASFEGIGSQRLRSAGFTMWRDHTGWASMGPLAALPRIPKLLAIMWQTAFHIAAAKPDLVILVDYGVFNLRLAQTLRRLHYTAPIVDIFPPGTWLDNERKAAVVSSVAIPVTAFEHQYDFYREHGLRIEFFGHPLAGQYRMRALRPPAPRDGGTIAVLPGSRSGELRHHLPPLAQAYRLLKTRRPKVRALFGAADSRARKTIARAIAAYGLADARIVDGVAPALQEADAAWVSSGTAVLECALSGIPAVALYVITPILVKHGRTMIKHRFITLPNLVLEREVVPELLQEAATPERLAAEIENVLADPSRQYSAFVELRERLGPPDALQRLARFAVERARA